jgi:hypothetical protein
MTNIITLTLGFSVYDNYAVAQTFWFEESFPRNDI